MTKFKLFAIMTIVIVLQYPEGLQPKEFLRGLLFFLYAGRNENGTTDL